MAEVVTRPGNWIGRSVKRVEDPRLLTGRGSYVDDVDLPGMLHAAVLRSASAHARIVSIDPSAALALPGVHAVLTARDLEARGIGDYPVTVIAPGQKSVSFPLLARDKVCYVGEALAIAAAESRYLAEDALELIAVELEELPVVVDPLAALEPDSTLLHEEWGDNVIATMAIDAGDVEQAFGEADLVLSERFRIHRHMAVPLETRGALATVDPVTGELTIRLSNQAPHRARTHLARILGWPEQRLRVIVGDVGGGFGLKDHAYQEEVLAGVLAIATGRPVKWIEDRQEHFLASVHAREQVHEVELAARSDGTILGLRNRFVTDGGAYTSNVGIGPSALTITMMPGPYRFPNYRADLTVAATNKVPSGAYRAFGQLQSTFVMERLIDRLARRLGLDPAEVRLRNFIQPDELPYQAPGGVEYDSGDYPAALRLALELADYEGWRARQAEWRSRGRHVGIGICSYIEMTGLAPSKDMAYAGFAIGGYENVAVEMDSQGKATVYTGMVSTGQSHLTTLAQLCATEIGVPFEDVTVVQGDTALTPYAPAGSIGSRGAAVGGAAVLLASRQVRTKLLQMAAHMLEASADDLEIENAEIFVRGTRDRSLQVSDVADAILLGHDLPEGLTPSLSERHVYDPEAMTYAYATHVAVVEVDVETGELHFHKWAAVHDCGTVINPDVVEGQVVGGLAQGLGGALLEELAYDEGGQLLTTSFMDYLLPTSAEIPRVDLDHLEIPAPHIPGGMKGAGEGGTIAGPAALANAVEDALAPLGAGDVMETLLSPARVWALVNS